VKHRIYTVVVVALCAAAAVPVWLLSRMSYLGALLTTLGVAVVVAAIGVLRDPPLPPRRVRKLGSGRATGSAPARGQQAPPE
jgi:carbon starvation protein CstA